MTPPAGRPHASTAWLITGGCGFIGRNLVASLLADDPRATIRVLDDLSASSRGSLSALCDMRETTAGTPAPPTAGAVELVVGDVREAQTVAAAAVGARHVVHLAAATGVQPSIEDPARTTRINVMGTLNTLEAARRANSLSVVVASSSALYPDTAGPHDEDTAPCPRSPYGASKAAAEMLCTAHHRALGLPSVVLRFSNVYGPGGDRANGVVAGFLRRVISGEPLVVHGAGDQTRDFVHVDDVVRAIVAASASGHAGEVFNIGTQTETSVLTLAQLISRSVSARTGARPDIIHGPAFPAEIRRQSLDIRRARDVLGWTPTVTLDRGVERLLDQLLQ